MPATKTTKTTKTTTVKSSGPRCFYLGGSKDGSRPELTPDVYDDFDESRLHIHEVTANEFSVGGMKINTRKSDWYYLDDQGKECLFYFFAPDTACFAPSYQYPLDDKKGKDETEDQADPSKRKGIQIGYPLTTLNTAENPTELEASFMNFLDRLRARGVEVAVTESKKKASKIPQISRSLIKNSSTPQEDEEEDEDYEERKLGCVKPLYTPARFDQASGKTKPPAWYVPLVTSGKGEELKCSTRFYVDDKPHSPIEFTTDKGQGSSRGNLGTPLFFLKESYWGQHGNDSTHGMSMKSFLVQADWEVLESGASQFVPESRTFGGTIAKYVAPNREDEDFPEESDEDSGEAVVKKPTKAKAAPKPKKAAPKGKAKKVEEEDDDEPSEDEEDEEPPKKSAPKKSGAKAKRATPKKIVEEEEEDSEEEEEEPPKKSTKAKAKPKKTTPKGKAKKVVEEDDDEWEYE